MKLEMDMPMTNDFIVWFNKTLCSWGQTKCPHNSAGKKIGAPAPLWYNESKLFFKILCAISFICSIMFIGSYVAIQFYNSTLLNNSSASDVPNSNQLSAENADCVKKSYTYLRSWFIIIGSVILFLNGI